MLKESASKISLASLSLKISGGISCFIAQERLNLGMSNLTDVPQNRVL